MLALCLQPQLQTSAAHPAHVAGCAAEVCSHRSKPLKNAGATRPAKARRLATGDGGPMSVVRHRSRESCRSRVTKWRPSVASVHPPDPPTSPSVCRALRRHSSAADWQMHFRPTPWPNKRHTVAVREAVRVGGVHGGAMGKPSGINAFKSEKNLLPPKHETSPHPTVAQTKARLSLTLPGRVCVTISGAVSRGYITQ